jgi:hypothetical protein
MNKLTDEEMLFLYKKFFHKNPRVKVKISQKRDQHLAFARAVEQAVLDGKV